MGADCNIMIVAVAVPAVIGALLLAFFIVKIVQKYVRHARRMAALYNDDWQVRARHSWRNSVATHVVLQIDYAKLVFTKDGGVDQSQRFQSIRFHSMHSVRDNADAIRAGLADTFATLSGQVVYVKRLAKAAIDVTMAVRVEVRDVRELRHANVLSFVGACVAGPHVCVLTEHAKKGGLDDILSNPDIKLDQNFTFSILKDVCRGMQYLHKSAIASHGRLKSSNCVVDNRWTVKITGMEG